MRTVASRAPTAAQYAAFLRRFSTPVLVERLLSQHETDPSGHCPTCRTAGISSAHLRGPCILSKAAVLAQRALRGTRRSC